MNLILGCDSMIGKQLCNIVPYAVGISHKHYDLTKMESCYEAFRSYKIANVYHLAGLNGGISMNIERPADIFYTTSQINLNVLKCCELFKVNKVISVLASCSYPDRGNQFLSEADLWQGSPNDTVECHGLAKRMLHAYSRQLHKQFKIKTICAILTNCYGPGDRFDLNRTKVVGAIVKKVCDAKINGAPSITCFGTGAPLREIMHCRDAAKCLYAIENTYKDYLNPINIGSDQEISIKDLVEIVKRLVGYDGEVIWDTSKPDGQMRKKLSTFKMKQYVDHKMIPLETGLEETIDYYMDIGRYLER